MKIKWHNRILARIGLLLLVLTVLSVSTFSWYGLTSAKRLMHDEMDRFTRETTARLASALGNPISRSNKNQIQALIEAELQDERIASIIVRNIDQNIILAGEKTPRGAIIESEPTGRRGFPDGEERIILDNKVLGSLELRVRPEAMALPLRHSITELSLLALGLNLLIFLALYLVLKRILTHPIQELTRAAESISLGQLESAIVNRSKNELGQLTDALERLRVSMRLALKRLASRKGLAGIGVEEWKNVILERKHYGFEFLALRILVGRLSVNYRNNPTPETMRRCVQQLIEFFQNEKNPLAQKDLNKILGGAAA